MKNKIQNTIVTILLIGVLLACDKQGDQETTVERSKTSQVEKEDRVLDSPGSDYVREFYIEEEKVGPFSIGLPIPEDLSEALKVRQFLAEDLDDDGKLIKHKHNVVFNQLEDLVELMMYANQDHHEDRWVQEMWVLSNYFETEKGVTVGDTKEKIVWEYEDVTAWYDGIRDKYFLETEELLGVHFVISDAYVYETEVNENMGYQEISLSKIDDEAEIIMIRVF